jgi:hypothetical protein
MTRNLALAVGLVAVVAVVSLIVFYVVQGPFGTINDVGNAGIGVLSAALAFGSARAARTGPLALGAAAAGAAFTVVGSYLVISDTTGFFLAGLVSSVGFALIGCWLVAISRTGAWAGRLGSLGLVAGGAMIAGFAGAPGALMGIDDMSAVPPWLWIFAISWIGTYILYPIWALRLAQAGPL